MTKVLWIVEEVAGPNEPATGLSDPNVDTEDMLFNAWSVAYTSIESAKRAVMDHVENDLVYGCEETPVLVWEPVDCRSSYAERAFIEELTTLFQVRPVTVVHEDEANEAVDEPTIETSPKELESFLARLEVDITTERTAMNALLDRLTSDRGDLNMNTDEPTSETSTTWHTTLDDLRMLHAALIVCLDALSKIRTVLPRDPERNSHSVNRVVDAAIESARIALQNMRRRA